MKNAGCLILTIATLALSDATHATGVNITGDDPRKTILISAEEAPVSEILQSLAQRYGFTIKGIDHVGASETITTNVSGSLPELLARLLRNRNHMIVRSDNKPSGIESVMILNSNFGTAPSKFMPHGLDQQLTQQQLAGGS